MTKIAFIGVVLVGTAISSGFEDKGSLQGLLNGDILEGVIILT